MTDYETLAWSHSALDKSAFSADDGGAVLRGLLQRYVSDSRGYVLPTPSATDGDDKDGDGGADDRNQLFFTRHHMGAAFVFERTPGDQDEDNLVDGDDEDNEQDTRERTWTGQCVGAGQRDNVYLAQDTQDNDDDGATLLALLLARVDDDEEEEEDGEDVDNGGDDAQRAYADALVGALGDVDEVHLHSDGSVALRKDRRLSVLLMGGVAAPAKIADASLTAAQADDGVTVLLGEVALLADEVGAAERALLADDAGAVVTALHNHWVSDPTLYYLHFQALTRDPTAFLSTIAPWWRSL
ncbi:hypothetical protein pqer_cds_996 [Pandoravirus quercus]|uniref:Uncharacterized protein n=2 Tax=Pandoravirus TaxID=2060084 RepID=A0A2U7UAD9_9VIRU|nr:hypothetical protein pqer_cds_996 [Pandoravirus quercus]AVK75418.1 hypothetical protein pqer_cds_996 [Pandoravirus quercus]QBZ81598.1 hypothetical protein pclt_cds_1012 [Pandoravirus celtis]